MKANQFATPSQVQLRPQQLTVAQQFDFSSLIAAIIPIITLALMVQIIKPLLSSFTRETF